jgi:hypothetical protein
MLFVTNNFRRGNLNKNKVGWLFLGLAGCFGLLFIAMVGQGYGLSNSQIHGNLQLNFMGMKIAEGITTTTRWNQYGTYFYLWSLVPLTLTIFCSRKFSKLVPTISN